jgi:hypothetical protein
MIHTSHKLFPRAKLSIHCTYNGQRRQKKSVKHDWAAKRKLCEVCFTSEVEQSNNNADERKRKGQGRASLSSQIDVLDLQYFPL